MSPTEFDLRAALHDGEEDGLDADRVLAGARAYRARRRNRIASTTAAVVCVLAAGGLVAGLTSVLGNGSGQSGGAGSNAGANAAAGAAGRAAPSRAAGAGTAQSLHRASTGGVFGTQASALPACPSTKPDIPVPTGPSATSGELVPQRVRSFVVCSYGSRPANLRTPVGKIIRGNNAAALTHSLRNAATHPRHAICPDIKSTAELELAIIGVTGPGKTLPPIAATLALPACNVTITNGITVRYDWVPPLGLEQHLAELGSGQLPGAPIRPGVDSGSPAH